MILTTDTPRYNEQMNRNRQNDQSSKISRPKVGLALGGGGARGFAHIGALQVLLENEIPIDMVAGTSMGGIIGSSCVCGLDLDKLLLLLKKLDLHDLLGVPQSPLPEMVERTASEYLFQRKGWRTADQEKTLKLIQFFKLLTHDKSFDEVDIPFACVAADVDTGEEIVMDHGKISRALAASAALPGIHDPVRWEGHLLVDGGIIDRVPIRVAVSLGAEIVIAVNVSGELSDYVGTSLEVIRQSMSITGQALMRTQLELMYARLGEKLLIVTPDVSGIKTLALDEIDAPVKSGREAMEAALPEIQRILETSQTSV